MHSLLYPWRVTCPVPLWSRTSLSRASTRATVWLMILSRCGPRRRKRQMGRTLAPKIYRNHPRHRHRRQHHQPGRGQAARQPSRPQRPHLRRWRHRPQRRNCCRAVNITLPLPLTSRAAAFTTRLNSSVGPYLMSSLRSSSDQAIRSLLAKRIYPSFAPSTSRHCRSPGPACCQLKSAKKRRRRG